MALTTGRHAKHEAQQLYRQEQQVENDNEDEKKIILISDDFNNARRIASVEVLLCREPGYR